MQPNKAAAREARSALLFVVIDDFEIGIDHIITRFEAVICGKRIVTARKLAWYGDSSFSYTYSGTTKSALPWTKELQTLESRAEEKVGCLFNSCLCR